MPPFAWHAITRAVLRPETTVVGGTGGVSLFALQIGIAAGARVLITSKSAQKLAHTKVLFPDGAGPVGSHLLGVCWKFRYS